MENGKRRDNKKDIDAFLKTAPISTESASMPLTKAGTRVMLSHKAIPQISRSSNRCSTTRRVAGDAAFSATRSKRTSRQNCVSETRIIAVDIEKKPLNDVEFFI
jgi:hypothetical protein